MTVIVSIAGKHGTEAVAYNFLFILFYFLCDRLSSCPGTHYVVDKAVSYLQSSACFCLLNVEIKGVLLARAYILSTSRRHRASTWLWTFETSKYMIQDIFFKAASYNPS